MSLRYAEWNKRIISKLLVIKGVVNSLEKGLKKKNPDDRVGNNYFVFKQNW